MDRNLIFWGIIELWIVPLGVPVVQKVVVHQVPSPALMEENVSTNHDSKPVWRNYCDGVILILEDLIIGTKECNISMTHVGCIFGCYS